VSRNHVLLVGIGDLGSRIAELLVREPAVGGLVFTGRSPDRGRREAARLSERTRAPVRFARLDAADQGAVEALLEREEPEVVVHCASLLSPWAIAGRSGRAAVRIRSAGFGLQLPAQLPLIATVMRAARAIGFTGAVINCSYPDLTNVVLGRIGFAPTIGAGNVAMIEHRVRSAIENRATGAKSGLVRVLAHHAHVDGALSSLPEPDRPDPPPHVYLGEVGTQADELAYAGPPLPAARTRNALTAAVAVPLVRALLNGGTLRTSAPGPNGLPGGYPVVVEHGRVALDLPASVDVAAAVEFQTRSARLDGIDRVDGDGTVSFTPAAARAVEEVDPELAAPLSPGAAEVRMRRLANALRAREPDA
jgi:hypothetical protein